MFTVIIILFFTTFVGATESKRSGEKKSTSINFEDELVEGEVKKPELLYLLQKKQFNFKRLIKLRENFLPEMDQTSESIGRGGGQN
ncbi:MAG: hypothetical protein A2Z20_01240 [Bdellovibrionales bacterium RBG_16_40_8]|nr:MAG: hypothetical protein A2Z20_01240 [Bdellovibrionales bacterium RBG_16_40_8]